MAEPSIVAQAPNGVASGSEARAAGRAATIAAMEAGKQFDASALIAEPAEAAPVQSDASVDTVDEQSAAVDESADASDTIEAKTEDKPDAETERRVAAVQKAEKRAREMLARERAEAKAEIERERAELNAWKSERDQFEQLKARAKYDPAAVLSALGLTDEDLEPAARDLYARSKGAASDPKTREAALKMQRDRENNDRLAAVERENRELREQFTKSATEREQRAAFESFAVDVRKSAPSEVAPLFEKMPRKAAAIVQSVIQDHFNEHGDIPDASDVAAAIEKRLPEMLTVAEYRAIYGDIAKPAAKSAANANASAPARTLGADMTGATPVPKDKQQTLAERREETRRLMEQGKLASD